MLDVCRNHHAADLHPTSCKKDPIHLGVACCISCVMQHCFSLVSSVLRCQLTAVLGDSFVLLPYLCAQRNSGTSHPTCSPHPPSLYIKLNLRSTSGNAEVGCICLPTQRGDGEVGEGFQTFQFLCKCNSWHAETFIWSCLKITADAIWTARKSAYVDVNKLKVHSSEKSFGCLVRDASKELGSVQWLIAVPPDALYLIGVDQIWMMEFGRLHVECNKKRLIFLLIAAFQLHFLPWPDQIKLELSTVSCPWQPLSLSILSWLFPKYSSVPCGTCTNYTTDMWLYTLCQHQAHGMVTPDVMHIV